MAGLFRITANDGIDAVTILKNNPDMDLAILDIMMPPPGRLRLQ